MIFSDLKFDCFMNITYRLTTSMIQQRRLTDGKQNTLVHGTIHHTMNHMHPEGFRLNQVVLFIGLT